MPAQNYEDVLRRDVESARETNRSRDQVIMELRALGEAFKNVLGEITQVALTPDVKEIPPLPSAVSSGEHSSSGYFLSLKIGDTHEVNVVSCRLASNGCYPCIIKCSDKSYICDKLIAVKRILREVAKVRLSAIMEEIDRYKMTQSRIDADQSSASPVEVGDAESNPHAGETGVS